MLSASTSTPETETLSPSSGSKPPIKSWLPSNAFVSESLGQDTSRLLKNGVERRCERPEEPGPSGFPKRADVENDLIDLGARKRPAPGWHQGGQANARSPAADRIGKVRVALLLLEGGIGQVPRPGIQVEGVESVPRTSLAVAALTVVTEDALAEPQLVAGVRRRRDRGPGRRRLWRAGEHRKQQDPADSV